MRKLSLISFKSNSHAINTRLRKTRGPKIESSVETDTQIVKPALALSPFFPSIRITKNGAFGFFLKSSTKHYSELNWMN